MQQIKNLTGFENFDEIKTTAKSGLAKMAVPG